MTLRAKMIHLLVRKGLTEAEAEEIILRFLGDCIGGQAISARLYQPEKTYSKVFRLTVWRRLLAETIVWMDEKCPNHAARENFTQGDNPQAEARS